MAMTTELQNQIYTLWLPVAITLVVAVIGLVRGSLREAIVGAAVVVGAFINLQWAGQWSAGLYSFYTGMSQRDQQFALSTVVLWLVVLVVGYGLGSLLPKLPLTAASRLGGGLLGLANGAALGGWSLRYSITNPDGTLSPGLLIDDPVSRAFMIWAGWHPLALALVAALLVLLVPLRRAQTAVAKPSAASDWTPSAPAPYSMMGPSSTPPASSAASTAPYAVQPRYPEPQDPSRTVAFTPQDAPPTSLLPAGEVPPPAPARPNPWSGPQSSAASPAATRQFDTLETPAPASQSSEPSVYGSSEPSWLISSVSGDSRENTPAPAQTASISPAPSGDGVPAASSNEADGSDRKCPNCGTPVTPGASFCTECGTRVA
jgi:hypothetical protein